MAAFSDERFERLLGTTLPKATCGSSFIPNVVTYYANEKANGHFVFFRLLPGTRLLAFGTKTCAWLARLDDPVDVVRDVTPSSLVFRAYVAMFAMLNGRDGDVVRRVLESRRMLLGELKNRETHVTFFDTSLPPPFKIHKPLEGIYDA